MPTRIPESKVKRMIALVDSGMPVERVAKRFRISVCSVNRYRRRNVKPTLQQPIDLNPRKKGYLVVVIDDVSNAAQALIRAAAELMEK